jgi:nucleoside-diphosphate-sugar epimerase
LASPNRILVTGANGLIGRHALAPLQNLGFEVHAVAQHAITNEAAGIRWHTANLLDASETIALMDLVRPTHLLNFAWYAEPGKFWESPLNLEWLSAHATLLQAFAKAGGRRFVGAGSCAEYDWSGDVYDEAVTALRPTTLYGAAKTSAFLTGSAFAKTQGFSFAWGRIFLLFGPGEASIRIVPALIRAHLSGQPLDCSQGNQLRDFLPASAVAEAFVCLCVSDVQGAVNIGSGKGSTLRNLSEKIAVAVGRKADIRFGVFHDSGPTRLVPKVDRLTREVGWQPSISLEAGLTEAVDWWKTQL